MPATNCVTSAILRRGNTDLPSTHFIDSASTEERLTELFGVGLRAKESEQGDVTTAGLRDQLIPALLHMLSANKQLKLGWRISEVWAEFKIRFLWLASGRHGLCDHVPLFSLFVGSR